MKANAVPRSVHGKKKYAAGHMDQQLRKAAGPQQKLPVHTQDWKGPPADSKIPWMLESLLNSIFFLPPNDFYISSTRQ